MLSLEEARQRILEVISPLDSELVPLQNAFGRVLADDVVSTLSLPSFDNSAMDGYAVISKDVSLASVDRPVCLKVIGRVAAGENFSGQVERGTCVRIFTGSAMPSGADAVVMQEDTRTDPKAAADQVDILDVVKPWENIRFEGEDIKKGTVVAKRGQPLNTGKISLLAAVGKQTVSVYKKPIVGLLATGSELMEAGSPLAAGKIYESNRTGLANAVSRVGGIVKIYPIVADNLEATQEALRNAFSECDSVVTSGGVSVGEFDFVKAAFEALGGEMSFWKVAIRPGKPFVFGRWQKKFLFGLPGNPVSALVTFFLLVRPALKRLQGATDCSSSVVVGTLAESVRNEGDRRHFIRVSLESDGQVRPSGIQASHIMSSLANANGLIDVPAKTNLEAGALVRVLLWD